MDDQPDLSVLCKSQCGETLLGDPVRMICFSMEQLLSTTLRPTKQSLHSSTDSRKWRTHWDSLRGQETAALWLKYMDLEGIHRRFIKAERTRHWELHSSAMQDKIPYLAAAGHNLYTKSIQVYLQNMLQLEQSNPVCHSFTAGKHVIRRSDRFWAGPSTDLFTEQLSTDEKRQNNRRVDTRSWYDRISACYLAAFHACMRWRQWSYAAVHWFFVNDKRTAQGPSCFQKRTRW